jgi:transposase-like protein
MTQSTRRQFSLEQKYKIIKEALTTDSSVSEICKKYQISTSVYYHWQEIFLTSAIEGFDRKKKGLKASEQRELDHLKHDNQRLKNVIAEVTSECIDLKKRTGNL